MCALSITYKIDKCTDLLVAIASGGTNSTNWRAADQIDMKLATNLYISIVGS